MPAHHKISSHGVRDPHSGPTPGDASFRLHFRSAEEFQTAMALAAKLEAKGLHRRAWRVRWNIDGAPPQYGPLIKPTGDDDEDLPDPPLLSQPTPKQPPPKTDFTKDAIRLIRQLGMSLSEAAKQLGVTEQAISLWQCGGRISESNYQRLRALTEINTPTRLQNERPEV